MKKESLIKGKVKKLIFVLLFLLIIFLVAIILILNNPVNKNLRYIYNEKKSGEIRVMPLNVASLFSKYNGSVPQRSLYKSMDIFFNDTVNKYYQGLKNNSDLEIAEYFDKNKEDIEKEIGITNLEDFKEFANEINKLIGNELVLEELVINPKSVSKQGEFFKATIIAKYKNNNKIGFRTNIYKILNKDITPIIYTIEKDEELLEYEYTDENTNTSTNDIEFTGRVIK